MEPLQHEQQAWRRALMDAAHRVERGWCQGHGRKGDCVCPLYAIVTNFSVCWDDMVKAIRELRLHLGVDVTSWNDMPGQTKEEVVRTMRAVATKGAFSDDTA
jgi:hypothetical protein